MIKHNFNPGDRSIYIYMYICVYIYICTYTYMCVYMNVHIYIHIYSGSWQDNPKLYMEM